MDHQRVVHSPIASLLEIPRTLQATENALESLLLLVFGHKVSDLGDVGSEVQCRLLLAIAAID